MKYCSPVPQNIRLKKQIVFFSFEGWNSQKTPSSQREVTLEEQGLHCVEEDHHKLHQLGKNYLDKNTKKCENTK